jgi:acetylornithine deacetylase
MIDKEKVTSEIETLLPIYADFLSKLVRIDSVYGKEKEAQILIKSKMETLGLSVQTFFSRNDVESINLVSRIRGASSRNYKSLILNAHCDVTPIDGIQRWARQPLSGEIVDNVLHGRGSQDDKAGLAIILMIVNVLRNLKIMLNGDLIIESVIEDETTGEGSKILVDNGYLADGVLIVDGTWSERIIYAHLGQIWIDVEIVGEPVAACVEVRGINPIYLAMEFIERLKRFVFELNAQGDTFEGIDKPYFLNVGSFHSGVWHGSVPAEAKLQIQIGFSDRYSPEGILDEVKRIAASTSNRITTKESILKTPACRTDRDNPLIERLRRIIERNSNKEALTIAVTGHCDMRHFPTQNVCLYGPGGGKNPHGIDEYYFLEQMPVVGKNIFDLVLEWCNEPK